MMCKDDVPLHKLQCGPFCQALGIVACIIKTFALLPAVDLSARSGRVQHSRHLLRDLPWAFRPGVVACLIVCVHGQDVLLRELQWAFRPGVVACLIVGVLKEPFVASPCSLPSSLRGIIASPCCSPSVMFGAGIGGSMLLL
eukprot:2898587-Rhodomonas_salina.1